MRRGKAFHQVVWKSTKPSGMEYCLAVREAQGWALKGVLVREFREGRVGVSYAIKTNAKWGTREVQVEELFRGSVLRSEVAVRDGRWFVNGREENGLEACLDIDLGASPVTNTLPIKRTGLKVGSKVDLVAAWMNFPSLEVRPLSQSYERTGPDMYVYSSSTGFKSEIQVDRFGFVKRYGNYWVAV